MKLTYSTVMAGIGTDQIDIAFPDFPGCVTVANSIQEAQERAAEVLSFHVQSMVEDDDPIPAGSNEQALLEMIDSYERDGHRTMAASIAIDLPTGKAKRVNVTLPEFVLEAVDRWAKQHGQTRSGLLADASMDYIARHRL
jgi:predicted RNase H-like HicB family nuclease